VREYEGNARAAFARIIDGDSAMPIAILEISCDFAIANFREIKSGQDGGDFRFVAISPLSTNLTIDPHANADQRVNINHGGWGRAID